MKMKQRMKRLMLLVSAMVMAMMLFTPVAAHASSSLNNPSGWENMTDAQRWEWLLDWAAQTNPNWHNMTEAQRRDWVLNSVSQFVPNWSNMSETQQWNWLHNFAYQAPVYSFETTWPVGHWGRPTTSNVAPQVTQNVRRDRHAAVAPPPHGTQSGFFSGEFATDRLNPFAPMVRNNPAAAYYVAANPMVFALQPGDHGVNVIPTASQGNGLMPSTSLAPGSGASGTSSPPHGNPPAGTGTGGNTNAPHNQPGMTVTHTPMNPSPGAGSQGNNVEQGTPHGRVTQVNPFADGTIARIRFPSLNNRVASVRPGIDMRTLDNYVGHMPGTSMWDGNIGFASHNRGPGSFFAGIWNMSPGDVIILETTLGVRTYEVISINQISEDDATVLGHTHDNVITMITCVYNQPHLRWAVRARQVG